MGIGIRLWYREKNVGNVVVLVSTILTRGSAEHFVFKPKTWTGLSGSLT